MASLTGSESGSAFYELGPQDFYTVYNENPLLAAGITGAGQTVAVIEEVQINPADVTSYRSIFGLPAYPATPNATQGGVNYFLGTATGLNGYASCLTPVSTAAGLTSGEEGEADLDVQWAGTVAPNATIDFVACGGTNGGDGSAPGSYGTDRAAQYIVNYLSNSVVAASMSYGQCEASMTTTNLAYYTSQWQQFAAEGITAIVSSGDGGAEQCYQNSKYAQSSPPSVNGFGSSAYNVSAGGTDFGDLYESNNYTTTPVTTWWNATNATGQSSAVTYIPETTWAGYCSSQLYVSYLQKHGSTTYGSVYTPQAICANTTANTNGIRAVVGGAGGISTYTNIPTWQSVYGVGLNSVSSTKRNIPDVSLFASNGFWGHFLPYCESDSFACTVADYQAGDLGSGGTSYVAPQLAGLMALVAQQTGSRQGNANYTLYSLAAQEYGTTSTPSSALPSCSGSSVAPGQRPPASCIFYDISNDMPNLNGGTITPGIYQPCKYSSGNCYASNGSGGNLTYGVNIVPGTTVASGILGYTASPGYDDATGLGSFNFTALVQGWNSVSSAFASTTALSSSAATVPQSGSIVLTASVTATGRGGAVSPAGSVTFYIGSTTGTNLGTGTISASCTGTGATTLCKGVSTLTVPGSAFALGTNKVVAYFAGDGANDGPSTSTAVTVTGIAPPVGSFELAIGATSGSSTLPQTDTLFVSGWAGDPQDGSESNVKIYIDGVLQATPTTGVSRPDVASSPGNSAYATSGFNLYVAGSKLTVGSHTATAVVTDTAGLTTTLNPLSFTVTAVYYPPVGNLEQAIDATTSASTVQQPDQLFVSGWAGDPQDGSPLSNVQVYIDGNAAGSVTTGVARPDVSAYTNSGYTFYYNSSSIAAGSHSVTVVAVNSKGLSTTFGPITITVLAPAPPPPVGNLDQAIGTTSFTSTISETESLFVNGWAASSQTTGSIAQVQVLLDGTAFGNATLGQSRPDVTAYPNSGWSIYSSAASIPVGPHTVSAVATDSTGLKTTLGSTTITVTQ